MTENVKKFIEDNIELIDNQAWEDLYDTANDWLTDSYIRELTKVLSDALEINLSQFAKDDVVRRLAVELKNFKHEKNIKSIHLPSFVTHFMSTINGVEFYEFQEIARKYIEGDPELGIFPDGEGSFYITKARN